MDGAASKDSILQKSSRVKSLDGVRGVAAFLVFTSHLIGVVPLALMPVWINWLLAYTPFNLLAAGRPPVILFFVLSGYVLSLPLMRAPQVLGLAYWQFITKRIARIYLPFAFAVLLSATLYSMLLAHPNPALAGVTLKTSLWSEALTIRSLFLHLGMNTFGSMHNFDLDPPMWSLVYEMRISLIFPFLFLIVRSFGAIRSLVTITAAATIMLLAKCTLSCGVSTDGSFLKLPFVTLYFVTFFVIGIAIAFHTQRIQSFFATLPSWGIVLLWIAALGFMSLPNIFQKIPNDFAYGIGAFFIIALILGSSFSERFFSLPPLVWLGKISYSFYLTHVIILRAIVWMLWGRMNMGILLSLITAGVIIAAGIIEYIVERHSIALGHNLAKRYRTAPKNQPQVVLPSQS